MVGKTKEWYETRAPYDEWISWWNRRPDERMEGEPAGREAYDHPDVTVDCAMLAYDPDGPEDECLKLLLVKRKTHPFIGERALTGTFLHTDENDAIDAVDRTIRYVFKDPLPECDIQQIRTFTGLHRDPRGQIVSVLHAAYMHGGTISHGVNDDVDAEWTPILTASGIKAFDHGTMVRVLIHRLQDQFDWTPNVFWTLPDRFTLDDAIRVRCGLYGSTIREVNRKNFRRKYESFWSEVGLVDPSDPRSRKIYTMNDDSSE